VIRKNSIRAKVRPKFFIPKLCRKTLGLEPTKQMSSSWQEGADSMQLMVELPRVERETKTSRSNLTAQQFLCASHRVVSSTPASGVESTLLMKAHRDVFGECRRFRSDRIFADDRSSRALREASNTTFSAMVVSLKDVVDAMDLPNEEWTSYLNLKTGEIVTVTNEERHLVEDEDLDEADLPEWQREMLPKMRETLESGDFEALPDKFEIHEWAIMERFASNQASERRREELLDAIHGRGAFRSFRSAIRLLRIEDDWFRFRQLAFEDIAKDWLREHGVSFR
jgi:hypothetical protein